MMMRRIFFLMFLLAMTTRFATGQQLLVDRSTISPAKAVTVYVFIGVDCPITQKYMGELNQIAKKYAKSVTFTAVVPGKVSKKEISEFVGDFKISFPVIQDEEFTLTKKWKATITPEVFVLDGKESVLYQGAIDNWFYDLGQNRQLTTEHYLADAITSALRGEKPVKIKTQAIGCTIEIPKAKR